MILRAEVPFSLADRLLAVLKDLEVGGLPIKVYSVEEGLPESPSTTGWDPPTNSTEYWLGNDYY